MSSCYPFRPVPGQCGPHRRGPLPAPPFDPQDYWATRKLVSSLFGSLDTTKLDKADVVDPSTATEIGKAADAKSTYEELTRISKVASHAQMIAESKADLVGGKVPAAQLPSYVDDVLEYDTTSAFPETGEGGKIYVAKDTNLTYRWSGTQYVEISPSPLLDDTVTETSPNGVKSSGIWSWGKSLLPSWLTSDYAEPATVASVEAKADKATTLAGYGITDAVPFVEDVNGEKTAVTIGARKSDGPVGKFSLANGSSVDAFNNYSHAEGEYTTASGEYSHAEGQSSTASGPYSHAEGGSTKASGTFSHVEGHSTQASGDYSHAEGNETSASGGYSHAEGYQTSADGAASHTEGYQTLALADYSHASGIMSETKSGHDYAFVWNGDQEINHSYASNGQGTFNINPYGGLGGFFIGDRSLQDIFDGRYLRSDSQGGPPGYVYIDTNVYISTASTGNLFVSSFSNIRQYDEHGEPLEDWVKYIVRTLFDANDSDFSNAVLAVGLNIDTNSVAVLNDIAATFGGFPITGTATTVGGLLAALAAAIAWLKRNKVQTLKLGDNSVETSADGGVAKLDDFFTESNSLLTGTIDEEIIEKGTAPDAHLEAPTDERLKLVLADSSVAYDSAKALPYKLTSVIGDRVIATMTLTAASTDITLPTIAANDTTVKDFILDVTNAYAVEGVATDAGINIPRTDFKLVTRDGESLTDVTTVKAGKSAFLCFTQKSPVVVGGTTYPCWCVIQLPFGDPS